MEDLPFITPPQAVASILSETEQMNFGMASEPLVGALLCTLAASKPGGRFLELGTGTGVATAWLLSGMDLHSTLVSVDIDEKAQNVAARALGHDPRLQLVNSGAIEYLATQPAESFDLVFADALPGKYEGLADALAVVRPGGFWVGDDLLPQPNWPEGHAAKVPNLLEQLAQNADFSVLPMVWATGVVLAVKRRIS
ncbi:MAG: class I SAM-dependent methyltransferase [Bryobacterales bacterium]|nr:class I SAM-dependent methyltransferase [Bryobacterales bacterium]